MTSQIKIRTPLAINSEPDKYYSSVTQPPRVCLPHWTSRQPHLHPRNLLAL